MTQRIEFRGKILPTHQFSPLAITKTFPFDEQDSEFWGFSGGLEIRISASSFLATLTLSKPLQTDFDRLLNDIKMHVRLILDSACFVCPTPYAFEIESFKIDKNETTLHVTQFSQLEFIAQNINIQSLINLSTTSSELRLALESLRMSIRYPSNTAYFSYKAIEAIRQYFKSLNKTKDIESWNQLNKALNISGKPWFEELIKASENQRHGESEALTGVQQSNFSRMAWEVVRRFIALLSNNTKTLSEIDFPILGKLENDSTNS
jgi:hypothetical protein